MFRRATMMQFSYKRCNCPFSLPGLKLIIPSNPICAILGLQARRSQISFIEWRRAKAMHLLNTHVDSEPMQSRTCLIGAVPLRLEYEARPVRRARFLHPEDPGTRSRHRIGALNGVARTPNEPLDRRC